MPTLPDDTTKRENSNILIKSEERALIDSSARLRGKNRTDFILDVTPSW